MLDEVANMGVLLDPRLLLDIHTVDIAKSAYYQIRLVRQPQSFFYKKDQAMVMLRSNPEHAVYTGLPLKKLFNS